MCHFTRQELFLISPSMVLGESAFLKSGLLNRRLAGMDRLTIKVGDNVCTTLMFDAD